MYSEAIGSPKYDTRYYDIVKHDTTDTYHCKPRESNNQLPFDSCLGVGSENWVASIFKLNGRKNYCIAIINSCSQKESRSC